MKDIDKNDVDISQLFKWNKEVEIRDFVTGSVVTVFIRLVGDADLNRAKAYGYRKASILRKELKTEGSESRMAYLNELDEYPDKSTLVSSIILLQLPDIYKDAMKDLNVPEPKEPASDAPQEDWEFYQVEVDRYPDKYGMELEKAMEKIRKVKEKELAKREETDLYKEYETTVIARLCETALKDAYYDMCVFLGTYSDKKFKKRAFESIEDYENSHSQLKATLREEYNNLELGTDLLKKLPEATA